jgi:hypothetical protein
MGTAIFHEIFHMKWFSLLFMFPFSALAQIDPALIVKDKLVHSRLANSGNGMFGFERNGKYGYIDQSGKEVIAAVLEFDPGTVSKSIPSFSNGYAVFKKDKKSGLIDKTGREVIPPEYSSVYYNAVGSCLMVSRADAGKTRYGLVSLQNKIIIPLEYEYMSVDGDVVVVQKDYKYGILDLTGKQLIPLTYSKIISNHKEKLAMVSTSTTNGVVDFNNKLLFEKPISVYSLSGVSQGLVKCTVSNKHGYLDLKGNEVVTTRYDIAFDFETNGTARVGKKNPSATYSYNYLYGYIDKKGDEVIPVKYEAVGRFEQGLVSVKDPETNRYGFMDKTGKWVIHASYIDAGSFDNNGICWVKMLDGKSHYISKTGKDLGVFADKFGAGYSFSDGFAVQEVDDLPYALIDKTGKVLKSFTDCAAVYSFSDGIAGFKSASSSLYGFINLQGEVITPATYTTFSGFTEGVSKVGKVVGNKTKYGYVNDKGQVIFPIEFDELQSFRNGWGVGKKDGVFFFIDKNGNTKEPSRKYDQLLEFRSGFAMGKINGTGTGPHTYYYINSSLKEEFSVQLAEAYLFWDEVAVVRRDKAYELLNKKGEVFKTLSNVDLLKFSTDGAMGVRQNGKWGFIDNKGNEITAAVYDSCDQFRNGFAKVRAGTKWGLIDRSGKEVVAPKYENIVPGDNGISIFLDNYWGVMDKTGTVLLPPIYHTLTPFEKDRALAKPGRQYIIIRAPRG